MCTSPITDIALCLYINIYIYTYRNIYIYINYIVVSVSMGFILKVFIRLSDECVNCETQGHRLHHVIYIYIYIYIYVCILTKL